MDLKQPSLTRAEMQRLERRTMEEFGIPGRVLMECAGRAVADEVLRVLRAERVSRAVQQSLTAQSLDEVPRNMHELEAWKASLNEVRGPVAILCGPGNNGGDGFVIARTLANHGVEVYTWFLGDESKLRNPSDAGSNCSSLERSGQSVNIVRNGNDLDDMAHDLREAAVVVDALFGTGLSREPGELFVEAIGRVNSFDKPCVAVDVPSGLDADSGKVHRTAILADLTVTFGIAKRGMLQGHGPDHCGRVQVVEMGIPRSLIEEALRQRPAD